MQILLLLFASLISSIHDLHLSMCRVDYNSDAKRIEVQQRLFYDDLEQSLQIRLDDASFDILSEDNEKRYMDSLLQVYINDHIDLYINEKSVELDLLEYEIVDDAMVLYLYKNNVRKIKSIDLFSHVLFELFDDQNNVVAITVDDRKRSQRFSPSSKPWSLTY